MSSTYKKRHATNEGEGGHSRIDFETVFEICDIKLPRMVKRQRKDRAVEEMAELTVDLQHYFRNKVTREKISEEVAHALITILYLSDIYDAKIVNEEINKQLLRWKVEYGLESAPHKQECPLWKRNTRVAELEGITPIISCWILFGCSPEDLDPKYCRYGGKKVRKI